MASLPGPEKHDAAVVSRYETEGSKTESQLGEEDPHAQLPLRTALKQYRKFSLWILGLSTVIVLWGYDLVVVGSISSLDPFQRDFGVFDKIEDGKEKWIIPAIWLSCWQAFPSIGQLIGAIAAGPMMDRLGRKKNILIGAVVVTISVLIEFLANRVNGVNGMRGVFLLGKILQGFATALIKMTALTYVSEVTPTCLRGAAMALFPACNLLGQFLGAVVVFGMNSLEDETGYLTALGIQWAFSIMPFTVAALLPESPTYLVRVKRMDEARDCTVRLFGANNDADAILNKLRISIEEEEKKSESISYGQCFKGQDLRRTMIVIFANMLPPLFGLPLLSSASYFLQQLGMTNMYSLLLLIVGIVIGFIGNVGAAWTLSHLSRRRLTVGTLLLASLFWGAMGVAGCFNNDAIVQWITAAFLMATILVCALGAWSTSYAIMSEVSSLRLRAKSQAIGGIAAYIASIFTNFVLPYLYNPDAANLKAKTGWVFMATSVLAALGTYLWVPEMKGRSPIEIDHLFSEGVAARKSRGWIDSSAEAKEADI